MRGGSSTIACMELAHISGQGYQTSVARCLSLFRSVSLYFCLSTHFKLSSRVSNMLTLLYMKFLWSMCNHDISGSSSRKSKNTSAKINLTSAGLLQILDGLPDGQARMVEGKRGHIYEGRWAAGLRHGQVLPKYMSIDMNICPYHQHTLWLHYCRIFIRC